MDLVGAWFEPISVEEVVVAGERGCQYHSWLLTGAKIAECDGFGVRSTKQDFPNSYSSSSLAGPVRKVN